MTTILGGGDFTGDGKPDVLARDAYGVVDLSRRWGRWLVPAGADRAGMERQTAIIAPGDFNGDGRADLLARDTAGILWLYPRASTSGWMPRVQVGQGWNVMNVLI